jgi:uncharacterized protein
MNWILFAFVGTIAQLIDGSLGMGFGLTSSTLLVTLGASAAVASAAVHFAEIGTTLASGASHWHAENIDKKILLRLAIPGGIGAFLGATFLSFIDLSSSKIFISTLLLFLGFLLLYRNVFKTEGQVNMIEIKNPRFLSYLGFTGGFIDASGGGGWGPVVLAQIGRIDIDWAIVGGLAIGGTLAAPFAAKLVGILPAKQLGIIVAVAIIALNATAIIRA